MVTDDQMTAIAILGFLAGATFLLWSTGAFFFQLENHSHEETKFRLEHHLGEGCG